MILIMILIGLITIIGIFIITKYKTVIIHNVGCNLYILLNIIVAIPTVITILYFAVYACTFNSKNVIWDGSLFPINITMINK